MPAKPRLYRRSYPKPPDAETQTTLVVKARRGDKAALDRLVEGSLGFLYQQAHRWVRFEATIEVEELVNEGVIGLMRAIELFDEHRGVKFITYASAWVNQAMQRAVAKVKSRLSGTFGLIAHASTKIARDVDKRMGVGLEFSEALGEVAAEHGVSPDRAAVVYRAHNLRVLSLDAPVTFGDDNKGTMLDLLHRSSEDAVESIARDEQKNRIKAILDRLTLSTRDRILLSRRLLADVPVTLADIARELDLSRERVRQIESKLLRRLRTAFEGFHPAEASVEAEATREATRTSRVRMRADAPRAPGPPVAPSNANGYAVTKLTPKSPTQRIWEAPRCSRCKRIGVYLSRGSYLCRVHFKEAISR